MVDTHEVKLCQQLLEIAPSLTIRRLVQVEVTDHHRRTGTNPSVVLDQTGMSLAISVAAFRVMPCPYGDEIEIEFAHANLIPIKAECISCVYLDDLRSG